MKVFISSVISGMEAYREAAAQAVRALGHEVVRGLKISGRSRKARRRRALPGRARPMPWSC